jgi:hypothetical protein
LASLDFVNVVCCVRSPPCCCWTLQRRDGWLRAVWEYRLLHGLLGHFLVRSDSPSPPDPDSSDPSSPQTLTKTSSPCKQNGQVLVKTVRKLLIELRRFDDLSVFVVSVYFRQSFC